MAAALDEDELAEAPLAMAAGMEALEVVMKAPQISGWGVSARKWTRIGERGWKGEGNGRGQRTHECFHKVRALSWGRWAKVRGRVVGVLGGGHRVLVFVRGAGVVGEGLGQPVGGADEGRFGVDVLKRREHK